MSLALNSSVGAIAPALSTSFLGNGGTPPYTYSVVPGGAGGTVNPSSGLYTAPAIAPSNAAQSSDVVTVTDAVAATATKTILVGDALLLLCEIIQREMGLAPGRVYLWDQKIMQPTDSGLYVAVGIQSCRPFANTLTPDTSGPGVDAIQSVNMLAALSIDVISRSTEALRRKEEVLMSLAGIYSQQQQEANSFFIGRLPAGGQFVNLSNADGSAIPYRFSITINIQYFTKLVKAVPYFDTFADSEVTVEP